ncbi:uncharacterized protein IL334_004000 [Kwoniella shivajii]|uniref:Uncharacterized protein n=1 Tax=Kwoniella shivajii TaxID=564305 RepID=A0ABZ1D0G5_9TREE|nr:hypothetical protein IL334_004000 [Kwoniella shivajii]
MSNTTFLLSSSSSTLPSSPSLSLLPFSLGTSSSPYSTPSAPILTYFKPRPIPSTSTSSVHPDAAPPSTSAAASNAGSGSGSSSTSGPARGSTSVKASFRGRTVIGQYIDIPKGWNGYILSTGKRPDQGGIEIHSNTISSRQKNKPLIAKNDVNGEEGEDEGTNLRRTTRQHPHPGGRVRGTGQIALSKPKTRARAVVSKKRYRLDSDDEDENDDEGADKNGIKEENEEEEKVVQLSRTPSKRLKSSYTTPKKSIPSIIGNGDGEISSVIPEIIIQEATPLKYPLSTPRKRLNERRGRRSSPTPRSGTLPNVTESMELVEDQMKVDIRPVEDDDEDEEEYTQISNEIQSNSSISIKSIMNPDNSESSLLDESTGLDIKEDGKEEQLIPSPSTEDDPPSFEIPPTSQPDAASSGLKQEEITSNNEEEIYDGPMRILKPISTFNGFMLYTPDDPLAGFRVDELQDRAQSATNASKEEHSSKGQEFGNGENTCRVSDESESDNKGIQVRQSWWRSGGAGEGGDEFIRGLGEWLGLVELLNEQVYLDPTSDEDDDEE